MYEDSSSSGFVLPHLHSLTHPVALQGGRSAHLGCPWCPTHLVFPNKAFLVFVQCLIHLPLTGLALAVTSCHFSTGVLYIIARSCWQGGVKQACNYLGNLSYHHALSLLPGQFTWEEVNREEMINLQLFRQFKSKQCFCLNYPDNCFKPIFCFANWKLT